MNLSEIYARATPIDSSRVEELNIKPGSQLLAFYHDNEGPFGSDKCSFTLLDITTDDALGTIHSQTQGMRHYLSNLPANYLVISDLQADAMLLYDTHTEQVYEINLGGGEHLLTEGKLEPEFDSFEEFVGWFFELELQY